MTTEILETYDLDGNYLGDQERKDFYIESVNEYLNDGKVKKKIKGIRVILMRSDGKIYIQKRSETKDENAGLYDKTLGGHVKKGDSFKSTLERECKEELDLDTRLVDYNDLAKEAEKTDLEKVALVVKIDFTEKFMQKRISKDGQLFTQPYITTTFLGYYDGEMSFPDGEVEEVKLFTLDELKREIKENSEKFTKEVSFIIDNYSKYLKPIS